MAEQRFSNKFLTSHHTQLQKQIYLKEEKFLGLPNQKKNFSYLFNEGPREPISLSQSPKPKLDSEISKSYSKSPTKANVSFKKSPLEQMYRSRIDMATKFKEKFDFNNRSPINWFSKEDKFHSPLKRKPNFNQDVTRISNQLNTKKIIKGMGYEKSFIFND